MAGLTTLFTPASGCSNRFAVFVDDHAPGTSIIPPSSGWVDPSFTKCIPTQYTTPYPTFSPGVCPVHMHIVKHTFGSNDGKSVWTAACCQSGFSPLSVDDEYLCTSAITTPMAFLLDPNISTTDVYTTLPPELWIEHDQVTVQWQSSDLGLLPVSVASQYAFMMGITAPPSTETAIETTKIVASSPTTAGPTQASRTSDFWSVPTTSGTAPSETTSGFWSAPTTLGTATSETPLSTGRNEAQPTPTNGGILQGLCGSGFLITILVGIAMSFAV
ncbi:hypothetical protein F5X97DRAFT_311173 [Nemania serpens]|nr:hypothetical protein F5X97DRAFT_311173 [Nemania serpens]